MKTLSLLLLSFTLLSAQPEGFQLIAGDAKPPKIDEAGVLAIQSKNKAIIQWDSFSIGENKTVRFDQVGKDPAVLNRVVNGPESALLGNLLSNGKVYVINPNGVLIGPNARIETAGFIASTLDVLNDDFLKGKELIFSNAGPGAIVHLGTISCPTGDVALLARTVDLQGKISAPEGVVSAATATELLLQPEGEHRIFIKVEDRGGGATESQEGSSLHQSGLIEALKIELKTSPNPYLKAIRCDGVLEAIEGVYVHANKGLAELNGAKIHCDSGIVHLLGESVFLNEDVKVDVSGDTRGGTILIGGDYLGQNPDIPNADYVFSGMNVVLDAQCRANGNGGKVILWGVKGNKQYGTIHAMGGPKGGDGGFVEISSLGHLLPAGKISTLALMGKTGTLLFDPCDVTISAAADAGYASNISGGTNTLSFAGGTATINAGTLSTLLGANNVVVDATEPTGAGAPNGGIITVTGTLTGGNALSWSAAHTLTLIAQGQNLALQNEAINFSFTGTIANTNAGPGNFNALVCTAVGQSTGGINFVPSAGTTMAFQTSYGNMSFTATTKGILTPISLDTSAGASTILSFTSSGTGAGAASFTFTGTSSQSGPNAVNFTGLTLNSSRTISTVDGNINITGTTDSASSGIGMVSSSTTGSPTTIQSTGTGNITMTGSNNSAGATVGAILSSALNAAASSAVSILSTSGNITLTGTNSSSGNGIFFQNTGAPGAGSFSIHSTSGTITINGTTTGGTRGIRFLGLTPVSTTSGNMIFGPLGTSPTAVEVSGANNPSFTTTSGNFTFNAPLNFTVVSPSLSTTGSVTFNSTVTNTVANTTSLSVTGGGGGSITFNGAVGSLATPLASLTVSTAPCNIGASITTVNALSFPTPVTITGTSTITSTTSTITFGNTLAVNAPLTLVPNTAAGTTFTFANPVTLASTLTTGHPILFNGAVVVSGTSTVTATGAGNGITFGNTLAVNSPLTLTPNATGANALNGAVTLASTLTSAQTIPFSAAVTVTSPSTVTSSAGAISFATTLDGPSSLTLVPSTNASFSGVVGGITPLSALTVSGTTSQSTALTATTTGNMTFSGAISAVGQNVILTLTTSGAIQTTGVTAANITMQPTNASAGGIPSGTIILAGGLTATGAVTLGASPVRGSAVRIATITSTFAGNDVTISTNTFSAGPFEATTVFGNLSITATNGITIGDAVASNLLTLHGTTGITVQTHGAETILSFAGDLYSSPSAHFLSKSAPSVTPTPVGTVNTASLTAPSVAAVQDLLTYDPSSYMLNLDTSLGVQIPAASAPCDSCCPMCPTCPGCSCGGGGGSTRGAAPFGQIVNEELVANSQLSELLPIMWPFTYWPYRGSICKKKPCTAKTFDAFSWNNDVR